MGEIVSGSGRARTVGLLTAAVLLALAALIFFGNRHEWFAGRYLLLTTLEDTGGLIVSSPVYYQGAEIGKVVLIREPEEGSPGYKVRMRVGRPAFRQISLDARVRVDRTERTGIVYVTILPGRENPDRLFPGKVKVLEPVTKGEQWFRMFFDIIEELEELSRAKTGEAEAEDLKAEVDRLHEKIKELEGKK